MTAQGQVPGPTVIVSRRVDPARASEFAEWHAELLAAASRFPGYAGAESQPPDELHPGEWVSRFRFDTAAHLEGWMTSSARMSLLVEGEPLVIGPVREHRVAERSALPDVVTAVISKRLKPGSMADYRRAQVRVSAVMGQATGYLGSSVSEPIPGVQEDHVTVLMFDSKPHLDRWLHSPERGAVLAEFDALVDGEESMTVLGGFGGWFAEPSPTQPKRWKQAVSVLLALYPTVLALSLFEQRLNLDLPMPVILFLSNIASVSILTWILMPRVTAVLADWLSR